MKTASLIICLLFMLAQPEGVRRLVISPFYNAYGLDWSLDGRYIVGSVCTETDADIFVIDTETGEAANLTAANSETPNTPQQECGLYG